MDIEDPKRRPIVDVAVVGAGLAGLSAAGAAARGGRSVVVLEAHEPGGRAASDEHHGVLFNRGAHALYAGGPGMAVLRRLGVVVRGQAPRIATTMGWRDGELHRFPTSLRSLVRSSLLRPSSKAALGRVLGSVMRQQPAAWGDRTIAQWLDASGLPDDGRMVMASLVRLATYTADHEHASADIAIGQGQAARHGVLYLDGGWASLVTGLRSAATRSGAVLEAHDGVRVVEPCPGGGFDVRTCGDRVLHARTVVVAAGSVGACRALLPFEPAGWQGLGPPAEASCLDMVLDRMPRHRILLGVGAPLYFSVHGPPAWLGPAGSVVASAARYLSTEDKPSAGESRAVLERLVRDAGGVITHARYLHRMAVVGAIPTAQRGGLRGRPPVRVAEAPGLYVAGDWVGPTGYLADGALVSGEAAGAAAADDACRLAEGGGRLIEQR